MELGAEVGPHTIRYSLDPEITRKAKGGEGISRGPRTCPDIDGLLKTIHSTHKPPGASYDVIRHLQLYEERASLDLETLR